MKLLRILVFIFFGSVLLGCEPDYEIKYYDNGKIKSKIAIKDGIYNGSFYTYFPNGNLATKGEWRNGEGNGYEERYFEEGGLKQTAYYTNGQLDGPAVVYHNNGIVQLRAQFINGSKTGKYQIYSKDGDLTELHLYTSSGVLYYLTKWGSEGVKVMELVFPVFSMMEEGDSLKLKVHSLIKYSGRGELKIGFKKNQSIEEITPAVVLSDTTTIEILISQTVDVRKLYYSFDFIPSETDTLSSFFFDHKVLSEKSNEPEFGS